MQLGEYFITPVTSQFHKGAFRAQFTCYRLVQPFTLK